MLKQSAALSFVIGHFTAGPHASIAALAVEETPLAGGGTSATYNTWLVPVTGEAELSQTTLTKSPPLDTSALLRNDKSVLSRYDWRSAVMTSVDLDPPTAGGIEEVITLAPPSFGGAPTPGQLLVSRITGGALKADPGIPIGMGVRKARWAIRRADINADGRQDIIVLADFPDGRKVQVFRNLGTGSLDLGQVVSVALPAGLEPLGFAPINVDADPELEIAVLTSKGVYVSKLDAQGTSFLPPTRLPDVSGGSAITAGDVTGDGVDDVIIVGDGVLQIFAGVPVLK